jgi:hypothetical protein
VSALVYRRGGYRDVSGQERAEIDVCLNCPLPECVGRRHADCPICDPQIVINECVLMWRSQVTRALGRLRKHNAMSGKVY